MQEIKVQGLFYKRFCNKGVSLLFCPGVRLKMSASRTKLKNGRPCPETVSFHPHLSSSSSGDRGRHQWRKNEILLRWAAQHKPKQTNLVCQSPQSKQTSSRARYWNPGQSLPANSPAVASLQETNSNAVIIIRRRGQRLPNLIQKPNKAAVARGEQAEKKGRTKTLENYTRQDRTRTPEHEHHRKQRKPKQNRRSKRTKTGEHHRGRESEKPRSKGRNTKRKTRKPKTPADENTEKRTSIDHRLHRLQNQVCILLSFYKTDIWTLWEGYFDYLHTIHARVINSACFLLPVSGLGPWWPGLLDWDQPI